MKKLSLLFFAASLVVTMLTQTNCKRKPVDPVVVVPPTDTSKHTKDTTGEDLHITVKESITATAKPVGNCVVYMVNNFDDWVKFDQNPPSKTWPPKANIRDTVNDVLGETMFRKVKPATGVPFPGKGNATYSYYIVAYQIDKQSGDTLWTNPGYAYVSKIGDPVTVNINNFQGKPKEVTVVLAP
jgi:hypothetical protein